MAVMALVVLAGRLELNRGRCSMLVLALGLIAAGILRRRQVQLRGRLEDFG